MSCLQDVRTTPRKEIPKDPAPPDTEFNVQDLDYEVSSEDKESSSEGHDEVKSEEGYYVPYKEEDPYQSEVYTSPALRPKTPLRDKQTGEFGTPASEIRVPADNVPAPEEEQARETEESTSQDDGTERDRILKQLQEDDNIREMSSSTDPLDMPSDPHAGDGTWRSYADKQASEDLEEQLQKLCVFCLFVAFDVYVIAPSGTLYRALFTGVYSVYQCFVQCPVEVFVSYSHRRSWGSSKAKSVYVCLAQRQGVGLEFANRDHTSHQVKWPILKLITLHTRCISRWQVLFSQAKMGLSLSITRELLSSFQPRSNVIFPSASRICLHPSLLHKMLVLPAAMHVCLI